MINYNDLTEEEKKEFKKALIEEEKANEKARKERVKSYKDLANETVTKNIKKLLELSNIIIKIKREVFEDFKNIIEIKGEIFGVKDSQQSHTFTSEDGNLIITLGYRTIDSFDDTVHSGIAKVRNFITRVVNKENKELQEIIDLLLKKDKNGNLKASRVLELERIASNINDEELTEGVNIIKEAWKPQRSRTFIEGYIKDEDGNKKSIPLSVTSVMEDLINERDNKGTN